MKNGMEKWLEFSIRNGHYTGIYQMDSSLGGGEVKILMLSIFTADVELPLGDGEWTVQFEMPHKLLIKDAETGCEIVNKNGEDSSEKFALAMFMETEQKQILFFVDKKDIKLTFPLSKDPRTGKETRSIRFSAVANLYLKLQEALSKEYKYGWILNPYITLDSIE